MSTKLAGLMGLVERLKEFRPSKEMLFASILEEALEALEVPSSVLAARFETSPSTVSRWANRKSAPAPYVQRKVANYLLEKALERLEIAREYAVDTEKIRQLIDEALAAIEHYPEPGAADSLLSVKAKLMEISPRIP